MLNYSNVKLNKLIVHRLGNSDVDKTTLSTSTISKLDDRLEADLNQYFFHAFKEPIFYGLNSIKENSKSNTIYNLVNSRFDKITPFYSFSVDITRYIDAKSVHPNIKPGDLFIFEFDDIVIDDELLSGIGIIKSESKDTFLQVDYEQQPFAIIREEGVSLGKVDKACLILNTDRDEGYKVLITDRTNRYEASFWLNNIFHAKIKNNDYVNTKNYIELTQSFVHEHMQPIHETDKMEEAAIMNRSQAFFSTSEVFSDEDYANHMFPKEELANAFLDYKSSYAEARGIPLSEAFDVSPQAVQKQSRFFKSVLKLDKNFHIYIHGNRDMIERGVDSNGRKYYKLYYEKER